MKRQKSLCAIVFLLVITLFMCAIGLRTFTRQVLVKRLGMSNAFTHMVLFDVTELDNGEEIKGIVDVAWAELYPFAPDSTKTQVEGGTQKTLADVVDKYSSTINSAEKGIEKYTTAFLPYRHEYIELANLYEASVAWDFATYSEYNGVVTTHDGCLTTVEPKVDVTQPVDATIMLADFCKDAGIPFTYVCTPSKVCKLEDEDICGVCNFENQNADEFLAAVKAAGVCTLDLRESLHEEGLTHHALFFRTDHHWLPQTGLWAANKVAKLLLERHGVVVDATRLDSQLYRERVYHDWFLGSQGKKVTLRRANPEDIALLYPEYNTNLRYEVRSLGIDTAGDFSVLYDMSQVEERDYYDQNPYSAYIYSNQPLEVIENSAKGLEGHVLVVHDSFGNTVVPFLAMGVRRVDYIDPRHFNGSIRTYIQTEHPDAVVVLYNPNTLGNDSAFELM